MSILFQQKNHIQYLEEECAPLKAMAQQLNKGFSIVSNHFSMGSFIVAQGKEEKLYMRVTTWKYIR